MYASAFSVANAVYSAILSNDLPALMCTILQENVGLELRPDESSDEEEPGEGEKKHRRLKRNRDGVDDDDDDAVKVKKKKGVAGLEEALGLAGGEDDGDDDKKGRGRDRGGYESEDSMASFISYDSQDDGTRLPQRFEILVERHSKPFLHKLRSECSAHLSPPAAPKSF